MGLLIKGSPIPQNCHQCDSWGLSDVVTIDCPVDKNGSLYSFTDRPKGCPLNHVPEHGRLIDADALKDAIDSTDWYHQAPSKDMVLGANSAEHQAWYKWQDINAAVYNAPTIIPAEEGEG